MSPPSGEKAEQSRYNEILWWIFFISRY